MDVKSQTVEVKIEVDSNDANKHTHDDKPRPYSCTVCHKRFTTKGNLTRHRALHTRENWYSCTQCEKRFATREQLSKHMNIHTGKYKCTECGRCCMSRGELAVHRRSHTGEKPFECNVCGKQFSQSGNLFEHSRIHSGEKPFECTVCNKRFTLSGNLLQHSRIHSGEKLFKCQACSKVFTQSSSLQSHMRELHTGEKPSSVHCVTEVSPGPATCRHINVVCTATVDHIIVLTVESYLRQTLTWSNIFVFTRETNLTSVHCVTEVSPTPAPCRNINVIYTATVDHIIVLTVENYLRQSLNWSFISVFTRERNLTSVHCVTEVSPSPATCRHINVIYTATVDHIIVLTVESYLS